MVKRRGNGEGSITRRKDGRWMARYTVHTTNGPKQKAVYGKTRAETAEKLTKAMAERDGGLVFDAGNLTIGEYLERWLSDSVRDTVRQRTYEGYAHIVERHIAPSLGHVKLRGPDSGSRPGPLPGAARRWALSPHPPLHSYNA